MRPLSRKTIFYFIGKSIFILIVFNLAVFCGFFAQAAWLGPTGAPPANNIEAPLNVGTIFSGDLTGTYNNLRINITPCATDDTLLWQAVGGFKCGKPIYNATLLDILKNDANAGGYTGGVIIGSTTAAWLNLGGAFTASWIHATGTGDNSIAGNLGIGTVSPNAKLHVYDSNTNAEIDLQSTSGDGNHWAIYNDRTTNDFRFWNNTPADDGYGTSGAKKNSLILTSLGQVLVGGIFGDRLQSSWLNRKFMVTGDKLTSTKGTSTMAYFLGPVVSTSGGAGNAYWSAIQTRKVAGTSYPDNDWRYSEIRLQFGMDSSFQSFISNRSVGGSYLQTLIFGNEQFLGKDILAISPNGNVGIGTLSPNINNKLEIFGKTSSTEFCLGGNCLASWPTGAVYIGATSLYFDGSLGGANSGYKGANTKCSSVISGSHVCTSQEILNSINSGAPALPTSGEYWINNGMPEVTQSTNDCKGWTSAGTSNYGVSWTFDSNGGKSGLRQCSNSFRFACCR